METSGRFEWIKVPGKIEETGLVEADADIQVARTCPQCGWVDGDRRFESLAGDTGNRECFRCGARWDLSAEMNAFFREEGVQLPPVKVIQTQSDFRPFFRKADAVEPWMFEMRLESAALTLRKGFDELLALFDARIDHFEHQTRTAVRVMKHMQGRALMADEVGMGKTVEAGIVIKELVVRGLAQHILILVPAGLTQQWRQELKMKFNLDFGIFSGRRMASEDRRLIVSYETARRSPIVRKQAWDMVVLDEAHRLKNRSTQLNRFVNELKSRYLLALSATPVQNSLNELYALADIVKPGKLGTIRAFRRAFVDPANPRQVIPGREATLREMLADIMIRNRRDACGVRFQPRRAGIYYIDPAENERALYEGISRYIKEEYKKEFHKATGFTPHMLSLIILQRELMSTPQAARQTLIRIAGRKGYPEVTRQKLTEFALAAERIGTPSKMNALLEILRHPQFKDRRFVIFTEFYETMHAIRGFLAKNDLTTWSLNGRMNAAQRNAAVEDFRRTPGSVLVSTEAGGLGLNLQFCSCLVNFDLPWNPMKIEQRIGRIDRIGQTREVSVFNLVCRDTIEEHVVDILAKKMKMFEMVIGEMNTILGYVEQGQSIERLIAGILLGTAKDEESAAFAGLGNRLAEARTQYDRVRDNSRMLNRIGGSA